MTINGGGVSTPGEDYKSSHVVRTTYYSALYLILVQILRCNSDWIYGAKSQQLYKS